jgi:Polypeptide deformylase
LLAAAAPPGFNAVQRLAAFGTQPRLDGPREGCRGETMAALGIVQEDDPILREVARPFDLPAEAKNARRVIAELASTMERVEKAHTFGKGMGIAAPQIGIGRAATLVRTPPLRAWQPSTAAADRTGEIRWTLGASPRSERLPASVSRCRMPRSQRATRP